MFYAKREMKCKHPHCPISDCSITFTADPIQSVGTLSIPSYIIQGFKTDEVIWNEEEKVGQRLCATSTDKYWYLDIVDMSSKPQKNEQFQPVNKIRTISERQTLRRAHIEINKSKKAEKCKLTNGAECKLEIIRRLSGCNENIPGKYLNSLMPYQNNMQDIVNDNVLNFMYKKSNKNITINHRIGQQIKLTNNHGNDEYDTRFLTQEATKQKHSLSSSSHYNLSNTDSNESNKNKFDSNGLQNNILIRKVDTLDSIENKSKYPKLFKKSFHLESMIQPHYKVNNVTVDDYKVLRQNVIPLPDINMREIQYETHPVLHRQDNLSSTLKTDKLAQKKYYFSNRLRDDINRYM